MNKKTLLMGSGIYLILKGIISLTGIGALVNQSTTNGAAMLLLGGMGIYISLKRENVLGRSLVIYGAFLIWSGVSALTPYSCSWL